MVESLSVELNASRFRGSAFETERIRRAEVLSSVKRGDDISRIDGFCVPIFAGGRRFEKVDSLNFRKFRIFPVNFHDYSIECRFHDYSIECRSYDY